MVCGNGRDAVLLASERNGQNRNMKMRREADQVRFPSRTEKPSNSGHYTESIYGQYTTSVTIDTSRVYQKLSSPPPPYDTPSHKKWPAQR